MVQRMSFRKTLSVASSNSVFREEPSRSPEQETSFRRTQSPVRSVGSSSRTREGTSTGRMSSSLPRMRSAGRRMSTVETTSSLRCRLVATVSVKERRLATVLTLADIAVSAKGSRVRDWRATPRATASILRAAPLPCVAVERAGGMRYAMARTSAESPARCWASTVAGSGAAPVVVPSTHPSVAAAMVGPAALNACVEMESSTRRKHAMGST